MARDDRNREPDETSPLLAGDAPASDSTTAVASSASSTAEEPPFPRKQILILCFARLIEPIAFFSIFSFITKMVQDVGGVPVEDVGFYSGLIESMFSVTQMCVMFPWGRASDRVGRKPVLVISMVGVSLASVLFGFATSIWQMVLFRCAAGVMAGSIVTIRTMIAENCSQKTQGTAFSWFAVAGNLGIFLGPLMGGALADPISQYKGFPAWSFLQKYPYALPGMGTGMLGLAAALTCFLLLEETLPATPKSDAESNNNNSDGQMSTMQIIRAPGVIPVLMANVFMLLLAFGYTAVSPVFVFTPVDLGGLAFTPFGISMYLCASGLSQALWLFFVFPPMQRRIGTRRCMIILSSIYPFIFLPIPLLNQLLRLHTPFGNHLFWIFFPIVIMFLPGIAMVFTAAQLAVNDVAPSPQTLGTLNAIVLTVASGLRSFSPALFSALYALSIKSGILGGHIFWGVFMVLGGAFAVSTRWLPADKKIN